MNPLTKEMLNLKCDVWLFPGQDLQTFHTTGAVIGTIHDLMHRYEGHFPEVSSKFRYYLREYRFKNILLKLYYCQHIIFKLIFLK